MVKLSNEIKTGAFVLVSVLLLIGVLYKTGDIGAPKKGYTVKTYFGFIGGVKKFAPVRLAGVEVGEVRELNLVYKEDQTAVEAILWVEDSTKLRTDSSAVVASSGLMGEQYIEISPGSSSSFVSKGGEIVSTDPVRFEALMRKASAIGDEVEKTLKDFRVMTNNLNGVLVDSKPKISRILGNLDGILERNRSKLDNIMDNVEETSEYFKEFSEDIKYHPWKVLMKGKEKSKEEIAKLRAEREARKKGEEAAKAAAKAAQTTSESEQKKRRVGFL